MIRPSFQTAAALVVVSALLLGCMPVLANMPVTASPTAAITATATRTPEISPTRSLPLTPPTAELRLWVSPDLPQAFRDDLQVPSAFIHTSQREQANLWLSLNDQDNPPLADAGWVYALVAPFPTLIDTVSSAVLRGIWNATASDDLADMQILVSPDTQTVLEAWWGKAAAAHVQVKDETDLLKAAWQDETGHTWAIVPFEAIQPRWKVLAVDGISPLEKTFDPGQYALTAPIYLGGQPDALSALRQTGLALKLPSNRQPDQLTVLILTGVTALSRHTAETMQREGNTYPGRDIANWLNDADLTHISNEVSFYTNCPAPGPERRDMRFCSAPDYIELFESLGVDIVELTGNHILDWGFAPFLDTLQMYHQRGWRTYGGGSNLGDAQRSLLIEHNGNRFAFIGCSPSGPQPVWATIDTPGSAPCDYNELEARITRLRQQGWLVVVTLQQVETDGYQPAVAQNMPDFRRLARAGAVIVSGSQSHYPQTMTFVDGQAGQNEVDPDHFVHYGLGNLFFDQMDQLATRQGFIDRHIFYNGRYLGVQLLPTVIEDYARPRPMTAAERGPFLKMIFSLSQWNGE